MRRVTRRSGPPSSRRQRELVVTTTPIETKESTAARPIVALRGTLDPFPVGRSLVDDVRYVAQVAYEEAHRTRNDLVIACARGLDAIELALRRNRGVAGPRDLQFADELERITMEYVESRGDGERWYGRGRALPVRRGRNSRVPKPDRLKQVERLGAFARDVALRCTGYAGAPNSRPRAIALMMTSEVWKSGIVDTSGRDRDNDCRSLEQIVRGRLRAGLARPVTPGKLVAWALQACGVPKVDAFNWCQTIDS